MKSVKTFALFVTSIFTVGLLLFELTLDGDISVRLRFDWKTKPEPKPYLDLATQTKQYLDVSIHTKPNLDSETAKVPNTCPTSPIAKADGLGRLGNQLATYVNHIALQWEYGKRLVFERQGGRQRQGMSSDPQAERLRMILKTLFSGYQFYLTTKISANLHNLLENVTALPYTELEHCNISYWPRARDWTPFTNLLAREVETCRRERKETFENSDFVKTCAKEQYSHINLKIGHNVSINQI